MRTDTLWLSENAEEGEIVQLRQEVRSFLRDELAKGSFTPQCNSWLEGHDPKFSQKLGARGWLGMTWPSRYGGQDRSGLARFVVLEELLAAGAPVAAHWIAERQSGPSLLRFGTEAQREKFLPSIARGECFFSIGMSEPDSGSDLASVRSQAHRVEGGWELSGSKIWTSHALRSHYITVLCRTSPRTDNRHAGLSQLLVSFNDPGVEVRPIKLMNGHEHFAEVNFDAAFVADDMLLGGEGDGWSQVNAELAYERSGPERFLSTFPLLQALVNEVAFIKTSGADAVLGSLIADVWTLRRMSQAIARQLDEGLTPQVEAALVKDLGTMFENDVVEGANFLCPRSLTSASTDDFERLLAQSVLSAPGFTLRGGTTEILRGVIAKALVE